MGKQIARYAGRGLATGLAVALVFGLGAGVSHAATVVSTGPNNLAGGFGNSLTLNGSDGTTVTYRAFSYIGHGNSASASQLNRFGSGLGVSNTAEGLNSPTGPHSTDNMGSRDGILLRFSQSVILDSAIITAWKPDGTAGDADSDVTYWSGTGSLTTPGDLDASLLGAGTNDDAGVRPQGNGRTVNFAAGPAVDWLFISARVGHSNDGFKFHTLEYTTPNPVPLPAAAWLGLAGLGMVGVVRRRQVA